MNNWIDWILAHPNEANAFAATGTAVLALLALGATVILTSITLRIQRRHNFMTVSPVAVISIADYENHLEVTIKNAGIGPLLVKQLRVTDGKTTRDDIYNFMPDLPNGITWTTFFDNIDGECIPANEKISLISLKGDPSVTLFADCRDQVRGVLKTLKMEIEYKDIYERTMPVRHKDLSWFGRNLPAEP